MLKLNEYLRNNDPFLLSKLAVDNQVVYDLCSEVRFVFQDLDLNIDYINHYVVDGEEKTQIDFNCVHVHSSTITKTQKYDLNGPISKVLHYRWKINVTEPVSFLGAKFESYIEYVDSVNFEVPWVSLKSKAFDQVMLPITLLSNSSDQESCLLLRKNLFKGTPSSRKICPECKNTGVVELFQFKYSCSLCHDGKRL